MAESEQSPWYRQAVEKGLIRETGKPVYTKATAKRVPPRLVEPTFMPPNVFLVPCVVPSLANGREWRVRNQVAQAHRRAVSRMFGRHLAALVPFAEWFHGGKVLVVTLTRLGGRELDRTCNLPASLKYVEDACALMLGASDDAPNWDCRCEQIPGGLVGVRIKLEMQGA